MVVVTSKYPALSAFHLGSWNAVLSRPWLPSLPLPLSPAQDLPFCFLSRWVWTALGSSHDTSVQQPPTSAGDTGSVPGLGRSPGEGDSPNAVSLPENPWTEEPGGLQSGGRRVRAAWASTRATDAHAALVLLWPITSRCTSAFIARVAECDTVLFLWRHNHTALYGWTSAYLPVHRSR